MEFDAFKTESGRGRAERERYDLNGLARLELREHAILTVTRTGAAQVTGPGQRDGVCGLQLERRYKPVSGSASEYRKDPPVRRFPNKCLPPYHPVTPIPSNKAPVWPRSSEHPCLGLLGSLALGRVEVQAPEGLRPAVSVRRAGAGPRGESAVGDETRAPRRRLRISTLES